MGHMIWEIILVLLGEIVMKYNRDFYYRYEPNIYGGKTIIINGNTGEIYKTSKMGCEVLDCICNMKDATVYDISDCLKIDISVCKTFVEKLICAGVLRE